MKFEMDLHCDFLLDIMADDFVERDDEGSLTLKEEIRERNQTEYLKT